MDPFGTSNSAKSFQENMKALDKKRKEDEEYKKKLLETTMEIRDNTESLKEIVTLLRGVNLKQDETKVLIEGISELIKANSPEDVENISSGIIGKIQSMGGTIDSLESIIKVLKIIKKVLIPLILI